VKRLAIIGGETHVDEVLQCVGRQLDLVGVSMKAENYGRLTEQFDVANFESEQSLLAQAQPDIVAIANENDLKYASVMSALQAGCDVIVDKPLTIYLDQQEQLEAFLVQHTERRLLNLLALRGNPPWRALRQLVHDGQIGRPAFVQVRMAVRLKRDQRPEWFLDYRRSGGLFLDLLIHGLDQVEWLTGRSITAVTASTGNLSSPDDEFLRDHAAVFCQLDNGGSAVVEGERMLPDTKGSDYRVLIAGTEGFADMTQDPGQIVVTNADSAEVEVNSFPSRISVVEDWIEDGTLIPQEVSLRANRLALLATMSANEHRQIEVS